MTVEVLDNLPAADAREVLRTCCGATRWVEAMLACRPFGTRERLLALAESVWSEMSPPDWEEAFAHHPRIGETRAAAAVAERAGGMSAAEQSGVTLADQRIRGELAEGNREYERRFGRIFIVAAAGRSAGELLDTLRRRLGNPADAELLIAAAEQGRITLHRLRTLISDDGAPPS